MFLLRKYWNCLNIYNTSYRSNNINSLNSGSLAVEESNDEKCQDELTKIGNNTITQSDR